MIAIGTKVKLLQDIIEPKCGDHPDLLVCSKGQICVVIEHSIIPDFNYKVKDTKYYNTFYVKQNEIKEVTDG